MDPSWFTHNQQFGDPDYVEQDHPMDELFPAGGRQNEEIFAPVQMEEMKHWSAIIIIFCADNAEKPVQYIDSLEDMGARKQRQDELEILNFLNNLGATINPPKAWKSVDVLPVPSRQGADCAVCVNEFGRRWLQGISFGEIDEILKDLSFG